MRNESDVEMVSSKQPRAILLCHSLDPVSCGDRREFSIESNVWSESKARKKNNVNFPSANEKSKFGIFAFDCPNDQRFVHPKSAYRALSFVFHAHENHTHTKKCAISFCVHRFQSISINAKCVHECKMWRTFRWKSPFQSEWKRKCFDRTKVRRLLCISATASV